MNEKIALIILGIIFYLYAFVGIIRIGFLVVEWLRSQKSRRSEWKKILN